MKRKNPANLFDELELGYIIELIATPIFALGFIIGGICICVDLPKLLTLGIIMIIVGVLVAVSFVFGVIRYSKASEERENELQDVEVLKGKLLYLALQEEKRIKEEDKKKNEQKNNDTSDSNAHGRSDGTNGGGAE